MMSKIKRILASAIVFAMAAMPIIGSAYPAPPPVPEHAKKPDLPGVYEKLPDAFYENIGQSYRSVLYWQTEAERIGGIAIDEDENTYVTYYRENRVAKFDAKGNFIKELNSMGQTGIEFMRPMGIAVGKDGKVYVAEQEGNRIQVFNEQGEYLYNFVLSGPGIGVFSPGSIDVDSDGNVYAGSSQGILKFNSSGDYINLIDVPYGGNGYYYGVAVDDKNDNLYLTFGYGVHKFKKDGTYLTTWESDKWDTVGQYEGPYGYYFHGVDVDDYGYVYLYTYISTANFINRVYKLSSSGSLLTTVDLKNPVNFNGDLAVSSTGKYIFATSGGEYVEKFVQRVLPLKRPISAPKPFPIPVD